MQLKICGMCRIAKSLSDFHKRALSKDGLHSRCKSCMKEYARGRNAINADAVREKGRKYYAANSESMKEYTRVWLKNNPHVMRTINAKRRAAKLKATPAWMNPEKVAEFYFTADFLGMVTGEWHHVDHVVPLQSEAVCGLHWEGNLQVLTEAENVKKGNRFWPDMPE